MRPFSRARRQGFARGPWWASMTAVPALWPFLVYCGGVCLLVFTMLALARLLGRHRANAATNVPFESGVLPVGSAQIQFSVDFYLVAGDAVPTASVLHVDDTGKLVHAEDAPGDGTVIRSSAMTTAGKAANSAAPNHDGKPSSRQTRADQKTPRPRKASVTAR